MAKRNILLVPLDFSRRSEKALDFALKFARERGAKIIGVHVIPAEMVYPQTASRFDLYGLMVRDARENFAKIVKRKKLTKKDCEMRLARGTDFADIIVRQAKKVGATMIIMTSHGRTGLSRFLLGSVAERTLRYAQCPVLIVK